MKKAFLLAAIAAGQLALAIAADKVTFQYNFKKDQIIRTHLVVNSNMGGAQMAITMDTSMHVDEAKDDGSAALTTQIDHGDMKMGGMKMAIPGRGKKYQMTVSKFGKRLEMGKDKAAVVVQEFPDHPIGVGESWDGTILVQGRKESVEVTAHFTFDSIKQVDGRKMAHVLVVEDGDMGKDMHVHGAGWMDWDIELGLPAAGHMEGTQDMGKMNTTFVTDQTTTLDK